MAAAAAVVATWIPERGIVFRGNMFPHQHHGVPRPRAPPGTALPGLPPRLLGRPGEAQFCCILMATCDTGIPGAIVLSCTLSALHLILHSPNGAAAGSTPNTAVHDADVPSAAPPGRPRPVLPRHGLPGDDLQSRMTFAFVLHAMCTAPCNTQHVCHAARCLPGLAHSPETFPGKCLEDLPFDQLAAPDRCFRLLQVQLYKMRACLPLASCPCEQYLAPLTHVLCAALVSRACSLIYYAALTTYRISPL